MIALSRIAPSKSFKAPKIERIGVPATSSASCKETQSSGSRTSPRGLQGENWCLRNKWGFLTREILLSISLSKKRPAEAEYTDQIGTGIAAGMNA